MRWKRRRSTSTSTSAGSPRPGPSSRRPSNRRPTTAAAPPSGPRCCGAKRGRGVEVERGAWGGGDGVPVTAKDVAFTLEVGKHPLSGVASSESYKRILKLDIKDDRHFTMTIDRVTFDYNSLGLNLVPAHIEKPIFDPNPPDYPPQPAHHPNSPTPSLPL